MGGCCALVSCSIPSAMYMYTVMCNAMYRAEVGVCVYPNPFSLSICMASLRVQRKSNGCGHCALGVTSVVYVLLHVYRIASPCTGRKC